VLDDVPSLTSESAEAVMQWLSSLIEAIGSEYAAEIQGHHRRQQQYHDDRQDRAAPWRTCPALTQLSLDLGEDYPF